MQQKELSLTGVLFKPEGDSLPAFLVQGPDKAFIALNEMLEATRADVQKHARGEMFSQDHIKEIRTRLFCADYARDLFKRLRKSNEYINKATEVWAECTRLLAAIFDEKTKRGEIPPEGRGMGRGKILKELQIAPQTIQEGRKLMEFSEQEIKERIDQLGANGPVYKQTLLRSLASSSHDSKRSKGRVNQAGPEKKEVQEELFALTRLMDRMEQNPRYFNQARFADETDFLIRIQDKAMLENCITCWEKVLEVLRREQR
jgi:hypothetical protein